MDKMTLGKCTQCGKPATILVAAVYNGRGFVMEYRPRCNKHDWDWQEKEIYKRKKVRK